MYCDKCGKYPATAHVKQTINGKTTEMNLCAHCAAAEGLGTAFGGLGLDLGDFWGTLFAEPAQRQLADTVRCPDCGRSFREIAQLGKPGCATCYTTFYDRLLPSIQRIHGKTQHTGKQPAADTAAAQKESRIKELKEQLEACIAKQEYEQCAKLRDEIHQLEQKGDGHHEG